MADITPPNEMPKDINDQLRGAMGLDPDDPNDTAFKLATILYFCVCHKNSPFLEQHTHIYPMSSLTLMLFPIAPLQCWRWHHWHSFLGRRVAVAACHGVVRVLLGWQRQGERAVVGVPWRFGVAALQHHWQQEWRTVAAVGVQQRFRGCCVRAMAG